MYAAIAGLRSHMQKLNVIGNNIANVNTYGYKAGRTVFETALYTTVSGGSNGTSTIGGSNPSQIGYGSQVGSIDIDMSTGNYALTGKALDSMIDGDGFYLVGTKDIANIIDPTDPSTFKSLTLTRVGEFDFRADGYLCDRHGNAVYGFLTTGVTADGQPIISDQLVPIRYPKWQKNETTGVFEVKYPTTGDGDNGRLTDATGDGGKELAFGEFDSITLDGTTGKISGFVKGTDTPVTIGFIAIGNVTNPNGVTQQSNTYYKCADGAGDLTIGMLGGAADDVYVGKPGTGNHTKGLKYVNGSMVNDQTTLSDLAQIRSGGTSTLITGGLEQSKTDLATEISEMITTQRGYQANTRIITVTDSMLEELVNMKR